MFEKLRGLLSRKKMGEENKPAINITSEVSAEEKEMTFAISNMLPAKTLHELLSIHFSLEEIADVCLELGIHLEEFAGDTKNFKALQLIMYLEKEKRLSQLTAIIQARRPRIFEDISNNQASKPVLKNQPLPHLDQSTLNLISLIRQHLSVEEIQDICQALDVPYTLIRGDSLLTKSRELVLHFRRRGYFPELVEACEQRRPDVDWGATAPKQNDSGYNVAAIRQLLENIFADDEAMTAFCQVHFPDVLIEFGSGMSFQAKITRFVDYCRRRQAFAQLLPALQGIVVAIYERHAPYE
jgi:hypothetical protein